LPISRHRCSLKV